MRENQKTMLDFNEPIVRTFLDYSYIFGVRGNNAPYDNFLMSHYDSLCFLDPEYRTHVYDLFDLFPAPKIRKLAQVGAIEADTYDLWRDGDCKGTALIDFLSEQLINGMYCLVTLDDFFLKGKLFYKGDHFIHHDLVVGLDRESKKIALAGYFFSNDRDYGVNWIDISDFQKAFLFKPHLLRKNDGQEIFALTSYRYIVAFRPSQQLSYELRPDKFVISLRAYLSGVALPEQHRLHNKDIAGFKASFGIAIYDRLTQFAEQMLDEMGIYIVPDLRLLSEHKQLMLERAKNIFELCKSPQSAILITELQEICEIVKKLRFDMYAESIAPAPDRKGIGSVIKGLLVCRDKELLCYEKIIKSIVTSF